jgi:hypothetical protein
MARKTNDKTVGVDAVKHKDKRKNIPTEELRDFVRDDEQKPKPVRLEGPDGRPCVSVLNTARLGRN